jgi:hypothetical protein
VLELRLRVRVGVRVRFRGKGLGLGVNCSARVSGKDVGEGFYPCNWGRSCSV